MKKMLLSYLLIIGLIFAFPLLQAAPWSDCLVVSAAETDAPANTSTTAPPSAEAPVPELSGWRQDSNGWYYLMNGTRLTGWQDLDGNRYYFNASGYRVSGNYKVDGTYYLFRPDGETANPGALCLGITGLISFHSNPDVYYYLTSSQGGVLAVSSWVKHDGAYYYANAKGVIKLGTIKVNKKRYHITKKGRLTSYERSSYDKGYYYAGSDGVLKTGFQTIDGKRYYFDKKTGKRTSGITQIGKYTYYFNKKGAAKTGWVKGENGKKLYYYDSKGRRVSGWYIINGKKYYFNPKKNDACVQDCSKKIGQYYYYFNAYGVLQTGFFTVKDNLYYSNAYGVRQRGWQIINGRKYYIDPETFVVKTGWLKYNNKMYYFNPSKTSSTYASMTTGFVNILSENGKDRYWYYFRSDGSLHTGWLAQNGSRYYFSPSNGRMLTGKQKIAGKEYTFGSNGAVIGDNLTGAWRIEVNRKGCFVVVYRGSTPVRAFVCSTAANRYNTPTGTFYIMDKLRWHELNGPCWGQYCSHITPSILFHSVPNYQPDNHTLKTAEYNKLGRPASGGCIRLTVKHAKYLYDNCPCGTKVVISDSIVCPASVIIERAPTLPAGQNYDPTDPYA